MTFFFYENNHSKRLEGTNFIHFTLQYEFGEVDYFFKLLYDTTLLKKIWNFVHFLFIIILYIFVGINKK